MNESKPKRCLACNRLDLESLDLDRLYMPKNTSRAPEWCLYGYVNHQFDIGVHIIRRVVMELGDLP
jgi:hypothetical protein